jgi:hypothetical protein
VIAVTAVQTAHARSLLLINTSGNPFSHDMNAAEVLC